MAPKERPDDLEGKTTRVLTGYGYLYVIINELNGMPFEIICTVGKSGQSVMAKAEVTGRLVSLALRNGVPIDEVITQLKGIYGEKPVMFGKRLIKSIPDAVAYALEKFYLSSKIKDKDGQETD